MRVRAEAFFTPEVDFEQLVTKAIKKAKKTIHVAMYAFTHPDFSRAMFLRREKGITCKVILDRYTANAISEANELFDYNINVNISTGWGKMHHKFCIIDSKIVMCGSANWSKVADVRNSEDYLLISSKAFAKIFETRFKKLWLKHSLPFQP